MVHWMWRKLLKQFYFMYLEYHSQPPSLTNKSSTIAQSDNRVAVKLYEDGLQESCNSVSALEGAKFVLATEIRDDRKLHQK